MTVTAAELLQVGGRWLGRVRDRVKWEFHNGDAVTWGSADILHPPPSIQLIERLAAEAVAADRNDAGRITFEVGNEPKSWRGHCVLGWFPCSWGINTTGEWDAALWNPRVSGWTRGRDLDGPCATHVTRLPAPDDTPAQQGKKVQP